ncbi:MAG: type II toxin-antitoxin system HicB family antitoxin [Methanosarcina sp.]
MYRFLVVIEKANSNYSAYSPDLPGCVATGSTREEARGISTKLLKCMCRGCWRTIYPFQNQNPLLNMWLLLKNLPPALKFCKLDFLLSWFQIPTIHIFDQ